MNKQRESNALRSQLASEIQRLRLEQPDDRPAHAATHVGRDFGAFEEEEKPSRETAAEIFAEFGRSEVDLASLASRWGIAEGRVRREVARGVAQNIFKVCMIVRKRNISKLARNFISQRNIQSLAQLILRPNNLRTLRQEYAALWTFISRQHEEGSFKNVTDEHYRLIYRELIILAEAYKVNENVTEDGTLERAILQQNAPADPFLLLRDFQKKQRHQTIDLVSDEDEPQPQEQQQQEQEEEQEEEQQEQQSEQKSLLEVLSRPVERGELDGQRYLQELVVLYRRMSELERIQVNEAETEEMARTALRISAIRHLIGSG